MTKAERRVEKAMDRARDVPGLQQVIADAVEHMVGQGEAAADLWERFHWGRSADKSSVWEAPCVTPYDTLTELGTLWEIAYRTRKDEDAVWVHPFEDVRPVLASTTDGRLVVVGGTYRITARGIEG